MQTNHLKCSRLEKLFNTTEMKLFRFCLIPCAKVRCSSWLQSQTRKQKCFKDCYSVDCRIYAGLVTGSNSVRKKSLRALKKGAVKRSENIHILYIQSSREGLSIGRNRFLGRRNRKMHMLSKCNEGDILSEMYIAKYNV